jgi:hypothetical protein
MLSGISLAPDCILKGIEMHDCLELAISRFPRPKVCSRECCLLRSHGAARLQRLKLIPFGQPALRNNITQKFVRRLAFAFGVLANEMIVSGAAAV